MFTFKKDLNKDLYYIGKYQRSLTGGNLVKIPLSKSAKEKDILQIIKLSLDNDVGFVRFECGKQV